MSRGLWNTGGLPQEYPAATLQRGMSPGEIMTRIYHPGTNEFPPPFASLTCSLSLKIQHAVFPGRTCRPFDCPRPRTFWS